MTTKEQLETLFEPAFISSIGIPKLRELILTLAMQGKLTEQLPSDTPVETLLAEIEKERKALIKAKKIRRQKALPEITAEETPFEIPKSWRWTRLQEIGLINPRSELNDELEVGFVPMRMVSEGYKFSHKYEIKKWKEIKSGYTHFANGDIAVAKITPCFENAKSCIFSDLPNGYGAGSTELFIYRNIIKNGISPNFLINFFKSALFLNKGSSVMTGTAGHKRIPREYFSENPIALPPIEEQQRIVEKLDQLMAHCDQLEKDLADKRALHERLIHSSEHHLLNADNEQAQTATWQFIERHFESLYQTKDAVERLRGMLLQLAVMGKLLPQDPSDEPASKLLAKISEEKEQLIEEGKIRRQRALPKITPEEIPFEIPERWEWERLGNISYELGQKKPDNTFVYIDVGAIDNKKGIINNATITEAKDAPSRARKLVQSGTIIYSTVRPYLKNIAKITAKSNYELIASTAFAVLHPYQTVYGDFLFYYLRSDLLNESIEKRMKGVAYPAINNKDFYNLIFPLPPLNEQQRIVEKLDQLMEFCDQLETKIKQRTQVSGELTDSLVATVA